MHNHLVKATDPFGNSAVGDWTPVTVSTTVVGAYGMRVLDDPQASTGAFGEPSGTVANDLAGTNPGTITGTVTRGAAGRLPGIPILQRPLPVTATHQTYAQARPLREATRYATEASDQDHHDTGWKDHRFRQQCHGQQQQL